MAGQRKITASEKKLFLVSAIAVAFIFAFTAWRQWVDEMPNVTIPTPQMPSPNAYDFYVKAGAAIIPAKPAVDPIHDPKVVPKSQWKTYYPTSKKEAWLRRNATALNLLRQGFQYPCRVPPQRSFSSPLFGNNGRFREMARMLCVESHAHAERGDWQAAAESALDILKLGHDMAQGGTVIEFVVGSSLSRIGRSAFSEVRGQLNASEAKSLAQRLEKIIQSRTPCADVLREEKYYGQARLLELVSIDEWRTHNWRNVTGLKRLSDLSATTTIPKRVVFNNYTDYMNSLIANAQKPYTKVEAAPPVPGDVSSQMISSGNERTRWHCARDETGNALLLVTLALHAHKLEHNRYPQSLSKLVPRYLKQVPTDPYGGGEALRYKRTGAKYSLYSIGPDGVDNRGRAIEDTTVSKSKRSRFGVKPGSEGDIVAGINQ